MTDNEIIKALEHCSIDNCTRCPYEKCDVDLDCDIMLMCDALDLIQRQQAEIEELKKGIVKENVGEDAFIEGTEFALDYGLPVPEEDLEKYEKIVDKSKNE